MVSGYKDYGRESGNVEHFSGTVPADSTSTITPTNVSKALKIDNTSMLDMGISFDGGTTFFTIGRGKTFTFDVRATSFVLQNTDVTYGVTYSGLVVY